LVLVSCEAFDNYPPGAPGRLLCATAALPGGTFLIVQLLRRRWIRHLPVTFGALQTASPRGPVPELDRSAAPQPQGPLR